SLAFDRDRGRVVMFGTSDGLGSSPDDLWEWDGTNWTQIVATVGPSADPGGGIVFDSALHRTIWLGVRKTTSNVAMWRWDGATWTQLAPAHVPSVEAIGPMAYDAKRDRIVAFGNGGTWTFDGVDWQVRELASFGTSRHHTMTYDSSRGVLVLTSGEHRQPTAEWDGMTWHSYRSTPEKLFATNWYPYVTAVYNERLGRTINFSRDRDGDVFAFPLRVCWEWDGNLWRIVRDRPNTVPPTTPGA